MKPKQLLLLLALYCPLTALSQNADTIIAKPDTIQTINEIDFRDPNNILDSASARKTLNRYFREKYLMNSDVGDITFFDQGHPDGRQYVLNGNIIPYFNITDKNSPILITINPIVRVRIFANQASLPVRTPSFVPGISVYFRPFDCKVNDYHYAIIGVYHHSNGQDNPALNADGSVNVYNGNFSTNYITLNYLWGKSRKINSFWKAGIELHSGLFHWADEPLLRSKLSGVRLNVQRSWTWFGAYKDRSGLKSKSGKEAAAEETRYTKVKVLINGMAALDNIEGDLNQRFNLEVKLYWNPFRYEETAFFFSTGYMGHDYYNVYFNQPYPFIRVGLAAGLPLFQPPKFRLR